MDLQLTGKNVLVTGSGQGLGRALGLGFAREGANVAFHYNSSAAGARSAAGAASELGVKAIAVGGDLRDAAAAAKIADRAETGLGPVDVLVNNAAVTAKQRFLDSTPQDWAAQIDVTVTGTLRVTHAVARRMAARKSGVIITMMGDSGRAGESGLLVTATARSMTVVHDDSGEASSSTIGVMSSGCPKRRNGYWARILSIWSAPGFPA